MGYQQIFLSHCVRSAGSAAKRLDDMVRRKGLSTFICVDMEAGDGFREAIVGNAANCKVMVLFIDQQWAQSKECKSEFNCAYSCFNREEWPKFVPIVIGGFGWIKPNTYPVAHCITSNFQCLVLDDDESTWPDFFGKVISKCHAIVNEANSSGERIEGEAENPSTQLKESITAFISCQLCQKIFDDPRILPCSHTFCLDCLKTWKTDNEPEPFCCPKCRLECSAEPEDLPPDFKANQMIEAHEILMTNKVEEPLVRTEVQSTNSSQGTFGRQETFPDDVVEWFTEHSVPTDAQRILFNDGFEFMNLILGLTRDDIDNLGFKTGHKRLIWDVLKTTRGDSEEPPQSPFAVGGIRDKSISCVESPQVRQQVENAANPTDVNLNDPKWLILDCIYDERPLFSGTQPADSQKFWASLTEKERNEFVSRFKTSADKIQLCQNVDDLVKSEKLRKVAMVLCDAGEYESAEAIALVAASFLSRESEFYCLTKAILCYATIHKLKLPMYVSENPADDAEKWKGLFRALEEVIEAAMGDGRTISTEMYIKMNIMKMFTIGSIKNTGCEWVLEDEESFVETVEKLCQQVTDKGLMAELLLTQANLIDGKEAVRTLLKAREMCLASYGEFSVLSSRCYYNMGCEIEYMGYRRVSYECFRRSWMIYRHIKGIHHPQTKKVAGILTDDEEGYPAIAAELGDSLPSDDHLEGMDLDYEERLKLLLKLDLDGNGSSDCEDDEDKSE